MLLKEAFNVPRPALLRLNVLVVDRLMPRSRMKKCHPETEGVR